MDDAFRRIMAGLNDALDIAEGRAQPARVYRVPEDAQERMRQIHAEQLARPTLRPNRARKGQ